MEKHLELKGELRNACYELPPVSALCRRQCAAVQTIRSSQIKMLGNQGESLHQNIRKYSIHVCGNKGNQRVT